MTTNTPRIDIRTSRFLDAARGISAIVVMLSHVFQIYVFPHLGTVGFLDGLWDLLASYAVMTFFVISGFVITISILENIKRNGHQFKPSEFLASRLIRLYPSLIFALLLTICVYGLIHISHLNGSDNLYIQGDLFVFREKASLEWNTILLCVFFLQGIIPGHVAPSLNGALWSLGYELWFYIIAMFFTILLVNKRKFWAGFIMTVLIVLVAYFSPSRFFPFLLTWSAGSVWAVIYHKRQSLKSRFRIYTWLAVIGIAALIAILVIDNGLWLLLHPYRTLLSYFTQSLICWLGMLVTMQLTIRLEKRSFNFFNAYKLAPFSYTLYLIHFPLLTLAFSFLHPFLHSISWVYSALIGSLLGFGIVLISSRLALWVENREMIRKFIGRFFTLKQEAKRQ